MTHRDDPCEYRRDGGPHELDGQERCVYCEESFAEPQDPRDVEYDQLRANGWAD